MGVWMGAGARILGKKPIALPLPPPLWAAALRARCPAWVASPLLLASILLSEAVPGPPARFLLPPGLHLFPSKQGWCSPRTSREPKLGEFITSPRWAPAKWGFQMRTDPVG